MATEMIGSISEVAINTHVVGVRLLNVFGFPSRSEESETMFAMETSVNAKAPKLNFRAIATIDSAIIKMKGTATHTIFVTGAICIEMGLIATAQLTN